MVKKTINADYYNQIKIKKIIKRHKFEIIAEHAMYMYLFYSIVTK